MLFLNRLLVVLCILQCFLFGLFLGLTYRPRISNNFCHGGISSSSFNCSCSYFIEFSLPLPPNPNRTAESPLQLLTCGILEIAKAVLNCTGNQFGDTCSYQCINGFTNKDKIDQDEDHIFSCNKDGMWEGILPICSAITCGIPETPSNAKVLCEDDNLLYKMKCEVVCLEGYYNPLSETSVLTCDQNGLMSGMMPNCEPVRCRKVSQLEDTQILCNGNFFGSVCNYKCKENYQEIGGSQIRTCQSNGTWSGSQLKCTFVSCPELQTSFNYLVQCNGSIYGSTCYYQCNPGYKMVSGSQYRTCGTNGTWSGVQITCKIIRCPEVQAGVNYSVNCQGRQWSSVCHYKCNIGYRPNTVGGSQISTCGINGEWSTPHLSCEPVRCLEPYTDADSNYRVECNGSIIGSICQYHCNTGYMMVGGSMTRTCNSHAQWSGSQLRCQHESVICPPLQVPPNSSIHCRNKSHMLICEYECDAKYKLATGSKKRKCKLDGWSGKEATCAPITCPKLVPPNSGEIRCTAENLLNSVCEYFCLPGFYLIRGTASASNRKCLTSGTWTASDEEFGCIPIQCPEVSRIGRVNNCNVICSGRNYQEVCRYNAFPGYELVEGDSLRNCTSDGEWSGTEAVCQKIETHCETLRDPENGKILCGNGTVTEPMSCYYTCQENYQLNNGSGKRICEKGVWSGRTPICQKMGSDRLSITTTSLTTVEPEIHPRCSALRSPINGQITCFTYHTYSIIKCKFQCFTGFLLKGPMETVCKHNSWSQNRPSCLPMNHNNFKVHNSCQALSSPSFSKMTCSYQGKSMVPVGTVCRYYCQRGTRISENSTSERICLSSGHWSGSEPTCLTFYMPACPFPNTENNCIRMCSGCYRNGCRCMFKPKAGYYLATGSTLRICVSGYWTGSEPSCLPKNLLC